MDLNHPGLFKCNQPDCSIETTGKCVNGLPVADCSNKRSIVAGGLEEEPQQNQQQPASNYIKIPWGDSFKEEDLHFLTYRYPCKMVALIGEPKCGKTTLYAAVMDCLHKGRCGKFSFVSTKTPIGFEFASFLARESSKGNIPDTERTKTYEYAYLHLEVADETGKRHLLFADVNGERYQDARNSDEHLLKLNVLKRSDNLFFIADGGKLCKNADRHSVKAHVWKMLDRCIEQGMFSEKQGIFLIVTKWDKILTDGKADEVSEFFIIPTLQRYPDLIKKVIRIASRSLNDDVPPRTGVDEFLEACFFESPIPAEVPETPITERQFQKFKYRITND